MPKTESKNFRISELIRESAARLIERETNRSSLITVTRVMIKENLKKAVIFVTVMPESQKDEVLAFLRRMRTDIRRELVKHARMPRAPMIEVAYDEGEKARERIEELSKEM